MATGKRYRVVVIERISHDAVIEASSKEEAEGNGWTSGICPTKAFPSTIRELGA
jgi:hypothetical protein